MTDPNICVEFKQPVHLARSVSLGALLAQLQDAADEELQDPRAADAVALYALLNDLGHLVRESDKAATEIPAARVAADRG